MTPSKTINKFEFPFPAFTLAIIGLVFSYHPLLQLGIISGVHLDISLSYLLVGFAVILALPKIWQQRFKFYKSPTLLLLASLVAYVNIAVIWSPNPVRGIITGLFWIFILAFITSVMVNFKLLTDQSSRLVFWLTLAYKIMIVWMLWQIFADAIGLSASFSLLPAAYSGDVFGFARPTGFALEPQFLGSLLLIPFAWLSYKIFKNRATNFETATFALIVGLLIVTLSRGALFGAAIIVILLAVTVHPTIRNYFRTGALSLAGLVGALVLIFSAAQIRTSDSISGSQAVSRAASHLTFSKISFESKQPSTVKKQTGYISSSTESRVTQSSQAISLWKTSPATVAAGVGTGGFGLISSDKTPGSIVNNYYLEILAEGGLIALGLLAASLASLLWQLVRLKQWFLFSLLIGVFSQAMFFSGNANILHIWAIVGVAITIIVHRNSRDISRNLL